MPFNGYAPNGQMAFVVQDGLTATNTVGQEREVAVANNGDPGAIASIFFGVPNNNSVEILVSDQLGTNGDPPQTGSPGSLIWDGVGDNDAFTANPTGLNVDLTDGGVLNAMRVVVRNCDAPCAAGSGQVHLTVHFTSGGIAAGSASRLVTLAQETMANVYEMPFSSFSFSGGANVDSFGSVGAIELKIPDLQSNGNYRFGFLESKSLLEATLTASTPDAYAGDTYTYTGIVRNPADVIAATVDQVNFSIPVPAQVTLTDAPALDFVEEITGACMNATLPKAAVSASCPAGPNCSIELSGFDLPDGCGVQVDFDVQVNTGLQLPDDARAVNQGVVSSTGEHQFSNLRTDDAPVGMITDPLDETEVSLSFCGDGSIDSVEGEHCDDSNAIDGDGCDSSCGVTSCVHSLEGPCYPCTVSSECAAGGICIPDMDSTDVCQTCGNGVIDPGEGCDDGVDPETGVPVDGDGCNARCLIESCTAGDNCAPPDPDVPSCTDDGPLPCCNNDPNGHTGGDSCASGVCTADNGTGVCIEPGCGNGVLESDEGCDDGNNDDGDDCTASCRVPVCVDPDDPECRECNQDPEGLTGVDSCAASDDGYPVECRPGSSRSEPVCVIYNPTYAVGGSSLCASNRGNKTGFLLILLTLGLLWMRRRRSGARSGTHTRAAIAAGLMVAIVLGAGNAAWAQDEAIQRDFSAERFLLASDSDGMLGVNTGVTLGHLNWELGFWMGLADDPLSLYQSDYGEDFMRVDQPFLSRRVGGSIVGAIGFKDRYQLGLQVPLIVNQSYQFSEDIYAPESTSGLGDIRVVPKVQLLFSDRHGVDVALIPAFTLPTGASDSYAGESGLTFAPEVAISRWLGAARAAGNIGYRVRRSNTTTGLMVDDDVFLRAAVGYRPGWSDKPVNERPLELDASVSLASRVTDFLGKFNTNHAEVIVGGSYQVSPSLNVQAGAGVGIGPGHGTPDWRLLASLRYQRQRPIPPPPPVPCEEAPPVDDPDCDGIPSAPVAPPAGSPPVVAEPGTPPPVFPIPESVWEVTYDYCPDTPGTKPYHGCPEPTVSIAECSGIEVSPSIVFEAVGDDIARPSKVPLEALALALKNRDPHARARVNIEVTGAESSLADKRGALIKEFLVGKGAATENLAVISHQVQGASGYQVAFSIVCPQVAVGECSLAKGSAPISVAPAIGFEAGTDVLQAKALIPLEHLAGELLSKYPDDRISIEVIGPDAKLAEQRAHKLLTYLRDKGVEEVHLADLSMANATSINSGTDDYSVVFTRHCQQPSLPRSKCQKFNLDRKIQFDVNSDEIKPTSLGVLKRDVAWILQDFPDVTITVEGHTSSEGRRDYNLDLSLRRAQSVVNYLAAQGIAASRLDAVGYGPDHPLVEEKTAADREKNRRIEFRVTYAKDCPCDKIKVDKIQFHFNSPRIKLESYPKLQDVARTLKARPDVHLRIEGHTSSEGRAKANQRLSRKRAAAVRKFLLDQGIKRKRLTSRGLGESQLLIDPDDTEEEREVNRRVEFIITESSKTCVPSQP